MPQYPTRFGPIAEGPFAIESVYVRRARGALGPRIQLPISPLENFITPITAEMYSQPSRPRLFLAPRIPLPIVQTDTIKTISAEMFRGYQPPSPRLFIAPRTFGTFAELGNIGVFSPEMFAGQRPSSPRIFLAPRIPLPISETINLGVFSPEMVQGNTPSRIRLFVAPRLLTPLFDPSGATLFSFEMVIGYQPSSPRLFHSPVTGEIILLTAPFNPPSGPPDSSKQFIGEIQFLGPGAILDASMGIE